MKDKDELKAMEQIVICTIKLTSNDLKSFPFFKFKGLRSLYNEDELHKNFHLLDS